MEQNSEIIEICVVGFVKAGMKNTRYLVKAPNKYYTILEKSGLYDIGDCTSVPKVSLEIAKEAWIRKGEKATAFYQEIINHMISYKTNVLKINDNGFYRGHEHRHVLPDEIDNLIPGCKSIRSFYYDVKRRGEIHTGFCNLNSSQAFAINFFAPLIESKVINTVLGVTGIIRTECSFEKTTSREEKTQFDFFVQKSDVHPAISVEVKYSEADFGVPKIDSNHIKKYEEQYEGLMNKLVQSKVEMSDFFAQYQLWRNILYVLNDQIVCFMFPSFRDDLYNKVHAAIKKCRPEFRNRVKVINPDDVVSKSISGNDDMLRTVMLEFQRKYLVL